MSAPLTASVRGESEVDTANGGGMHVEVIPVGAFGANCCILWDNPALAWVVDPGADGAQILRRMEKLGVTAGVVVLTHAHIDHISALNEILAEFPSLTDDDVRAVVAFAAASASEDLPAPTPIPPEIKVA